MRFLCVELPKEKPSQKAIRYLGLRSKVPITFDASLLPSRDGVTLKFVKAVYIGPNVSDKKTGDCLVIRRKNSFFSYPQYCSNVLKMMFFPPAVVIPLLAGCVMVGSSEGRGRLYIEGVSLVVFSVVIGVPAYILFIRNFAKKIKINHMVTQAEAIVSVGDFIVDEVNKGLDDISQSEYLIRLVLQSWDVKVGPTLPMFNDQMLKVVDEYQLLSAVKDEDWPYLSITGEIYHQFKSYKNMQDIKNRRQRLKDEIEAFPVPILDDSGQVSLNQMVNFVHIMLQSGILDFESFQTALSSHTNQSQALQSAHSLFANRQQEPVSTDQIEMSDRMVADGSFIP